MLAPAAKISELCVLHSMYNRALFTGIGDLFDQYLSTSPGSNSLDGSNQQKVIVPAYLIPLV